MTNFLYGVKLKDSNYFIQNLTVVEFDSNCSYDKFHSSPDVETT